MTKKQIKRYAIFLRKKTWGQFHYEDDNWYGFFSKKQLRKHLKKVSSLIKGKNYQYALPSGKKQIPTPTFDLIVAGYRKNITGNLKKVHPSAANNMLLKEAQWFNVDTGQVGYYLKDMFENYKKYKDLAKRQGYYSRTNFSFEKMKEKLDKVLEEKTSEIPKQVELKLPKLKKIGKNKTELPKLKLPKLKKVEA